MLPKVCNFKQERLEGVALSDEKQTQNSQGWVNPCWLLWFSSKASSPSFSLLFSFSMITLAKVTSSFLSSFSGDSDSKESACYTGGPGSMPGSGRSPGEGNDNPPQDSRLENSWDREAWQATVHGVVNRHKEGWHLSWLSLGCNPPRWRESLHGPRKFGVSDKTTVT